MAAWMGAARTARMAFQQYGLATVAAGGVIVASHHHHDQRRHGCWSDERSLLQWHNTKKTTSCEAFKRPSKKADANAIRRRMTSVGRFSLLSETTTNPSVPVLILCLSGRPWTARDFLNLYNERKIGEKHERFRSTMDGDHFVVQETTALSSVRDMLAYPQIYRTELKGMIGDALLAPMDLSKGLWEVSVGTGGKIGQSGAISSSRQTPHGGPPGVDVESLLLFRAHHCMADGVSLGAIFGDLMDEGEEFRALIEEKVKEFRKRKRSWWNRLQIFLYYWCWGSIKALGYQLYLYYYSIFMSPPNPWKLLQQASLGGMDGQVRTLSWVEIASVEEVKEVADYFTKLHPNSSKRQKMTINDIFCSCITGATAKLMEFHRQEQGNPDLVLPHLNLVIPVHLAGGIMLPGSPLGNKIGALVNQVPAEAATNASDRLHQVHEALWNRKQTPAAPLSFMVASLFGGTLGTLFGKRVTSWLFSKAHANASIVVTNVRGPEKAAHLDGRRVETHLGFLPLPPGVPLGMVVTSYDQRMTLTVMAESWAVPDADKFLSWVVEEYQVLLNEAKSGQTKS
jgi:diacylglycerol O-acyltransferase / wax synthase